MQCLAVCVQDVAGQPAVLEPPECESERVAEAFAYFAVVPVSIEAVSGDGKGKTPQARKARPPAGVLGYHP